MKFLLSPFSPYVEAAGADKERCTDKKESGSPPQRASQPHEAASLKV